MNDRPPTASGAPRTASGRPPTASGPSPAASGPARARSASERAFMVAAIGVSGALIAFGPESARPFGLIFLAAAGYVLVEPRLAPIWAALAVRVGAAGHASSAGRASLAGSTSSAGGASSAGSTSFAGGAPSAGRSRVARMLTDGRVIAATLGVGMIAFAALGRNAMPAPLPVFYAGLGAIAIVAAILLPRMQRVSERWGRAATLIAAIAGAAAVVALGWVTVRYGTNTPFFDEYASTLPLAVDFPQMTGAERHEAILASHNGHRIATTRLATLAHVALTGRLDFYSLMLFSYGILVAAALVIASTLRAGRRPIALAAPFLLILFQPQYHQLTLWAFSIQHFAVVLFAALSFALLARRSPAAFAGAAAFGILATYSFGSGILVGVVGLFYLIAQRRHASATLWLLLWGVIVAVYFRGLSLEPPNGPQMSALGKVFYLLEFLGSAATLGAFTDFIGGGQADAARYPAALWAARIASALMIGAFGWLTLRQYWTRNATVYGLLAVTALSAVLAAALRSTHPYAEPFMSRYTLNSCLFAALLAVALLDLHWATLKTWSPAITLAAAVFCIGSFAATVPHARAHSADLRYVMLLTEIGRHAGALPWKIHLPFYDFALLERARDSGVYIVPEDEAVDSFAVDPVDVSLDGATSREAELGIAHVGESESAYTFFIAAPESAADANDVYVVIEGSAGGTLKFAARTPHELGIHERFFGFNSPPGTTYLACVCKSGLPTGKLDVSLAVLGRGFRGKTPQIATVGTE